MFEKINNILAQWDPIDVGYPNSKTEYTQYVPQIIKLKTDTKGLELFIISMLNSIGLYFDKEDQTFKKEIEKLINQIQKCQ